MNTNTAPSELNIVSRILLQKILNSDAAAFLSKECVTSVNNAFLSPSPEKDNIKLTFKSKSESGFYSGVAELSFSWEPTGPEIQDLDGNVWVPHRMRVSTNINSSYNNTLDAYLERSQIISATAALLEDTRELITSTVKLMTLTDEQRHVRDTKRAYDVSCKFIVDLIKADRNSIRRQLRVGGRGRPVLRSKLPDVQPGKFEVEINDGSKRTPRIRKYSMFVPENPNHLALLKRIA